ncbi:unnamed protein product [Paramecium sonneborni]|uniref:Uncharacterized protein n=1 Tax=Paramecium sonneborni TaxID=65129 RepID=A0A8S1N8L5_9CILI|nr:unnamed protein product [Paramecium sonneborni]
MKVKARLLLNIRQILCHSAVINNEQQLFIWFKNYDLTPQKQIQFNNIIQATCEYQHTLILDQLGQVQSWGVGDEGQIRKYIHRSKQIYFILQEYVKKTFFRVEDQTLILGLDWKRKEIISGKTLHQCYIIDVYSCEKKSNGNLGHLMSLYLLFFIDQNQQKAYQRLFRQVLVKGIVWHGGLFFWINQVQEIKIE